MVCSCRQSKGWELGCGGRGQQIAPIRIERILAGVTGCTWIPYGVFVKSRLDFPGGHEKGMYFSPIPQERRRLAWSVIITVSHQGGRRRSEHRRKLRCLGVGMGGAQRPHGPHRSGTLDSCVASSPDTCLEPSQPRWSLRLVPGAPSPSCSVLLQAAVYLAVFCFQPCVIFRYLLSLPFWSAGPTCFSYLVSPSVA